MNRNHRTAEFQDTSELPSSRSRKRNLVVVSAGVLSLPGAALAFSIIPGGSGTENVSAVVTDVGPTPSNGNNDPNLISPRVTLDHAKALKLYEDVQELDTLQPAGTVNCPVDFGNVYEVKFSDPSLTISVHSSGCENVIEGNRLLVASSQLETDIRSDIQG